MNLTAGNEETDISVKIELLRGDMNRLGDRHGLLHPEVMRRSRELDELLVRYYRINRKSEKHRSLKGQEG